MATFPVAHFHLIFAASLIFAALFLAGLRGFRRPTRYLLISRLFHAVVCIVNYAMVVGTPLHGHLLWNPLHLTAALFTCPMLFAYLFQLMRPGSVTVRYWLAVFAPFALLVTLHCLFGFIRGPLPPFTHYAEISRHLAEPELWVRFAATVQLFVMTTLLVVRASRMLMKHLRNLPSNFSYTEGATLGWIWWCLLLTVIKMVAYLLSMSIEGQTVKLVSITIFTIEPVITTIWALHQKDLYIEPAPAGAASDSLSPGARSNDETPSIATTDNYGGLPPEKCRQIKQALLALLEKDEVFKDSELNLEKMRSMLGTSRTYLSQVINREMNTTFYQLVNSCRLNKASAMLRDAEHRFMPLKNIAEICGFKSLSAFSSLFKQTFGLTPSEWREQTFALASTQSLSDFSNPV